VNLKADHVLHHQTPTTNQLFTSVSLAAVLRLRISFQVAIQDRFILCEYKWVIPGEQRGLMRAALVGDRIPMIELLVSRGANVNALWSGYYPIIFAPC